MRNTSAVTLSKMLSHLRRSERCPPTSKSLYVSSPILKWVSLRGVSNSLQGLSTWVRQIQASRASGSGGRRKRGLDPRDARGLDSRAEDVLVGRHVCGLGDALDGVEVAGQGQHNTQAGTVEGNVRDHV
jgi:hypothetical protein